MNDLKWFSKIGCEKLTIDSYKSISEKRSENHLVIDDAEYIRSLQVDISRLPIEGDMMVKMGPDASYLTLEFSCAGKAELIKFYNGHIQTPATSFYSKKEAPDQKIWKEIHSLFETPKLGQTFPKIKNKFQTLDLFSVEYLGSEDRTPKETTASLFVETYAIVDKATKSRQIIEVKSGQLSPKPQQFQVAGKRLTLNTLSLADGTRLPSRQFTVY